MLNWMINDCEKSDLATCFIDFLNHIMGFWGRIMVNKEGRDIDFWDENFLHVDNRLLRKQQDLPEIKIQEYHRQCKFCKQQCRINKHLQPYFIYFIIQYQHILQPINSMLYQQQNKNPSSQTSFSQPIQDPNKSASTSSSEALTRNQKNCHSGLSNIEKLSESIQEVVGSANLCREQILLLICFNYYFKLDIYQKENCLKIDGILVYSNGSVVCLTENYRRNLFKNLHLQKKTQIKFFEKATTIAFSLTAKLKELDTINSFPFTRFLSLMQSSIDILKEQLTMIGIHRPFNHRGLKLKKQRLNFMKNINDIVSASETPLEISQQVKRSVLTECSSIEVVEDEQMVIQFEDSVIQSSTEFEVKKQFCRLQKEGSGDAEERLVAVKSLKQSCQEKRHRLTRQTKIIKTIKSSQNCLKYWACPKNMDKLYMEFIEDSLDNHIYCYENSVDDLLNMAKQIVLGVANIQQSGIVHRDLKPENILVQKHPSQKRCLKIIDFGDSALSTENYKDMNRKQMLGSTFPYSPPETLYNSQIGFNKKEIDLWSIGTLIYELAFKECPININSFKAKEISRVWFESPEQFNIECCMRKKPGIKIIETMINMICINTIRVRQEKRMRLQKMLKMLEAGEQFLSSFLLH